MDEASDGTDQPRVSEEAPLGTRDTEAIDGDSWYLEMKAALAVAPIDDEPLTDEDRAAIEAGSADYRGGRTVTLEELLERGSSEDEVSSSEVA
jgi:hypothetical protein